MRKDPGNTILLIENDPEQTRLIREMFDDQGSCAFELTCVEFMNEAEEYFARHSVDIALLDLNLSDSEGLAAFRRIRAAAPHVPIVLLSNLDDEPIAVQAIHEGAREYLIKGQIEISKLMRALSDAIERKMIEEIPFDETTRVQIALDGIASALICTDLSGNITFLNPVAEKMTGWALKEATGRRLTEAFRVVDQTNRKAILDPTANAISHNRTGKLRFDCILIHRDGHEFFIESFVAPIHDREGRVTVTVVVFRDVSVSRAQAQRMGHSQMHDLLTGLPNRLLVDDRIGQGISLARRDGKHAAILFLDLDGFDEINISLGRPTGDTLLQSVARRLLECVRAPDTVGRQEGDKFVVLLQGLQQPEDAANTARRLLQAVAAAHPVDHRELHITASIGVSVYPEDGLDAETLIGNANTAMRQAKKGGIHSYQFYMKEVNVRIAKHQSIKQRLRIAVEQNELTLHYQPKIDLRTGAISGAEALSRWMHPTRGSIPPARFIPIAEESGLILQIDAWVLREACAQARVWADAGVPAKTIAVNISGVQFQSEDFLGNLFAVLGATGLNPRSLELDVAESVLMQHPERTAFILKSLKDGGVQVSADNFGTGNSSLSSLRRLPLDALKIDRSFVRQITTAPDGMTTVKSLISMGRRLNLRIIAEGVETAEDLDFLWAHDCDEAQGNFFSRPVPPEQLASLLRHNDPGSDRVLANRP